MKKQYKELEQAYSEILFGWQGTPAQLWPWECAAQAANPALGILSHDNFKKKRS